MNDSLHDIMRLLWDETTNLCYDDHGLSMVWPSGEGWDALEEFEGYCLYVNAILSGRTSLKIITEFDPVAFETELLAFKEKVETLKTKLLGQSCHLKLPHDQ